VIRDPDVCRVTLHQLEEQLYALHTDINDKNLSLDVLKQKAEKDRRDHQIQIEAFAEITKRRDAQANRSRNR
jgi:hypothetical protein